jgi:hypothetical protein
LIGVAVSFLKTLWSVSALVNLQPKLDQKVGCLSFRDNSAFELSGIAQLYPAKVSTPQVSIAKPAIR